MTIYHFGSIKPEDLLNIKYVRMTGYFQISTEIDHFEMYATFRGTDYGYKMLAQRAINIYLKDTPVFIEDSSEYPFEVVGIAEDQMPYWPLGVFRNIQFYNRQDQVAAYEMNQVNPTGRARDVSSKTGEKYSRGVRKNSRRYSDFETGEYGFA
ncbi:MAG: hypothetical protein ACYDG3_11845 [Bacillati bacterium]